MLRTTPIFEEFLEMEQWLQQLSLASQEVFSREREHLSLRQSKERYLVTLKLNAISTKQPESHRT